MNINADEDCLLMSIDTPYLVLPHIMISLMFFPADVRFVSLGFILKIDVEIFLTSFSDDASEHEQSLQISPYSVDTPTQLSLQL